MYSLWMARPLLYEGFVVLNCDVLFHPVLLNDLLTSRHENALLLAYREADQPPFGDEEMKVQVRCGRVREMSKQMDPDDADGENLGIVKFGPEGAAELVTIMDRLVAAGGLRDWAPRAFREFAQVRPLHAIGTRGFPWIEIDFPEDYQRAVREVLPQIDAETTPTWICRCSRSSARRPARPAAWRRGCAEVRMVSHSARAGTDAPQNVASSHDQLPRVVAIGGGTGLPNVLRGSAPAALRLG